MARSSLGLLIGKPRMLGGGERVWRSTLYAPGSGYELYRVTFEEETDAGAGSATPCRPNGSKGLISQEHAKWRPRAANRPSRKAARRTDRSAARPVSPRAGPRHARNPPPRRLSAEEVRRAALVGVVA